jgi:hypothetical protein
VTWIPDSPFVADTPYTAAAGACTSIMASSENLSYMGVFYEKVQFFCRQGISKKYYTCIRDTTHTDNWPFDLPQYLLLNLAVGGSWGGYEGIDDSMFPVENQIDYVRIYRF